MEKIVSIEVNDDILFSARTCKVSFNSWKIS